LQQVDDPRFVDLAHQVVAWVQSLLTGRTPPSARVEIETSKDWRILCGMDSSDASCLALLWLEELLERL
jgi:hypothetical protein